jgi:hypothetical protein
MTSLLLLALLAGAPDPAAWRQVVEGDVQVFARSQPGQRVAEIKADMVMTVTPAEVRAVLLDEEYTRHSPYVGEYRTLDSPEPNLAIRYTRLALPVVDDRDYFIAVRRDTDLAADGTGVFHSSWVPWGLDRPARKGVIRVTVNSGYWDVKPAPDGVHAQVEYYLMFDPGGAIPAWAVDAGNKRILPDVLHALQKEALRRREASASK